MDNISYDSDYRIWQAFQLGDKNAFESILKKFYPVLLNYGKRHINNADLAQDCLQDFFLDLWNRRQNLTIPISIQAYLLASYRRRLFKEKETTSWFKKNEGFKPEHHKIEVQFNIEKYLINTETENEILHNLKKQLDTLTKRQREALYLRFYQELSYEQISEVLSINHHSAVNLVYEAIKVIRKNWVLNSIILGIITTLF